MVPLAGRKHCCKTSSLKEVGQSIPSAKTQGFLAVMSHRLVNHTKKKPPHRLDPGTAVKLV